MALLATSLHPQVDLHSLYDSLGKPLILLFCNKYDAKVLLAPALPMSVFAFIIAMPDLFCTVGVKSSPSESIYFLVLCKM